MVRPKIIVILGPTATGKSDLAVLVAKKFGGEVISADSRQVYKGLDIGTGKITKKEMFGVPHHLLDVANPGRRFTASDFKKQAEKATEEILNKNKLTIICGGTGFYIDTLLGEAQISEVPPNEELRAKLENKSAEELFLMLQKLDPKRAKNIDPNNKRRLIRAIEICKALGKNAASAVTQIKNPNKYEVLKLGLKIEDEILKQRINKRLEKRIKIGMIKEATKLHKKGLSYKRMRELGLEYGALADFLDGKITKQEMIERLQKEIWHYAKRQMTYFKRDKKIKWLEPNISMAEKEIRNFL